MHVCLCLSVLINAMSKIRNRQPKRCFFQPYNMIYYLNCYFLCEVSSSPGPLVVLQHLFYSRKLACLWLLSGYSKFMLGSQYHILISIHSHCPGYLSSSQMPYLTVLYIASAKKFGNFERLRKLNFYIHLQNSSVTFTIPLTSDNYTERLFHVFLKCAIRNIWSSILKPLSVQFLSNMAVLLSQKNSSEWHDIKKWGPNSLPDKLFIRNCRHS